MLKKAETRHHTNFSNFVTRKAQAPWSRAIGTGRPLREAALWLPKRSEVTELVGAGARQLPS
ncbi:hypothetical protein BKP37_12395 [Anaerobacillus alkalilacustris]|uniref:Uncharacterized protein n=1 Tax=Anaerobacillus alkalilacustris TaxID=393763 RepID=A0A1S2LLB3_9BACI|nr:hypothetical protein BKP37_12395 [Anaerobacillus alkalilacustris]